MALTDTRPETDAPVATTIAVSQLDAALGSGDHKTTGRLWLGAGALMLLAGLAVSTAAALEGVDLGSSTVVDDQGRFIQLWAMGRELLLFGGLVPLLIGLATFIVPLQVGSSSLAFPRGASAAFWSWFVSTDLLVVAYIFNGGPGGGRNDYVVMWALALSGMLLSIMWALVCIATTVLGARATGMSLDRVPVSAWGFLVFSLGGLLALPILVAQLALAYIDIKYGFLPDREARTSLLAITDTATLAPGLYWVGVPVLGIAVEAIGVHTGAPIRFRRAVMAALGLLGLTSFGAEFFAFAGRGRGFDFHNGLLVVSLLLAAVPVLASLALAGESLKRGTFKVRTPLVAGLLAGLLLLVGVLVGILGAVWPIVTFIESQLDTNVSLDSAFDVNGTSYHDGLRGLIMGAGVLGAIAGVHHWGHKVWGRSLDDRLGLLTALAAAGGAVAWAVGGVASGFLEQTRLPLSVENAKDGVEAMNGVTVLGTALLAVAALLLALNLARTAFGGGSANEPWQGATLEWATASPPPAANFDAQPIVTSALPLIDGVGAVATTDASDGSEAEAAATEESATAGGSD